MEVDQGVRLFKDHANYQRLNVQAPVSLYRRLEGVRPDLYPYLLTLDCEQGGRIYQFCIFGSESEQQAQEFLEIFREIFREIQTATNDGLYLDEIKEIAELVPENKSYSASHVAAAIYLEDFLQSAHFRNDLGNTETLKNHTPLHVAVIHGNHVSYDLISAEPDESFMRACLKYDKDNNNLLHIAAASNEELFELVLESLMDSHQTVVERLRLSAALMQHNNNGFTPLQLAAINKKMKTEICQIRTLTSLVNMRSLGFNETALHLSTGDDDMVLLLLQMGADPNLENQIQMRTLEKALLENRFESVFRLLAHGAEPNRLSRVNVLGLNAPIHLAAKMCSPDCLKALINFDAEINSINGLGYTARHIVANNPDTNEAKGPALFALTSVGAKRCPEGFLGCKPGCIYGGDEIGQAPPNWCLPRVDKEFESVDSAPTRPIVNDSLWGNTPKGGRVLCMDGGGIRGLALTQILKYIEQNHGDGRPILSNFEYVGGTSTGGILAMALASGKTVMDAQNFYIQMKDRAFSGGRRYSREVMQGLLEEVFGHDTRMTEIVKPKLMVMAADCAFFPPTPYVFRNFPDPEVNPEAIGPAPEDLSQAKITEVVGAAPTFFRMEETRWMDAGLTCNNPTSVALKDVVGDIQKNRLPIGRPSVVCSFGCGKDPSRPSSATNFDVQIGGFTGLCTLIFTHYVEDVVELATASATLCDKHVVERDELLCSALGSHYYRLTPEYSMPFKLDEKSNENLNLMMYETTAFMNAYDIKIRTMWNDIRSFSPAGS